MNKADYIKKRRFLSSKIVQARESAGFSQQQVSKILSISQSTLSKIENGDRRLDFLVLLEMAKLYNQPITYFIPETQTGK